MAILSYVRPQVEVFEDFNSSPLASASTRLAHISGPHAFLVRHAESSEKSIGALGTYDPADDVAFEWPGLPLGAIIDPDYTKLFIDNARLQYFSDLIGAGDTVAPVAGKTNQVRIADSTYGFRANGVNYPRFPALADRDAKLGDRVYVRGVVGGFSYELNTYITGFAADAIASAHGAAAADAGNGPTQSAASVITQVAGEVNCNSLETDLTSYQGLTDGQLLDTYTVVVTKSSTGGDLTTALLKITSASGLDDSPSVTPNIVGHAAAVGVRGLKILFHCSGSLSTSVSGDDLIIGQRWTVVVHAPYVALVATAAGTFTGESDTTYIVTCTRGGKFSSPLNQQPQISVTTTTGIDNSGPTTITALSTAFPAGSDGLTVSFAGSSALGMAKGDKWLITATAAKNGRFGTLLLAQQLPTQLLSATDLDLKLSIAADLEITANRIGFEPLTNWEQTAGLITVDGGIEDYDPSYTLNGVPAPLPVVAGDVFVEYRAWRQELCTEINGISDVGELDAAISGPLTPDNPLKWGVFKALTNSNGSEVKFTAVCNPVDPDSWLGVLEILIGQPLIYNLVPLTFDKTVLTAYAGHVRDQSSPTAKSWRAMFCSLQAVPIAVVVSSASTSDGTTALAKIAANPDSSPVAYTLLSVPAGNANFLTNGVAVGDQVRYQFGTSWGLPTYTTYTVARVVSEDTLLLASGPPAAVTTASKVEIWHPRSKNEQAAALASQAAAFGSNRVCAVWPDRVGSGGTTMDGFHVAAALAGLRSGILPHQSLTNLQITGFDDVSRSNKYFNESQLDTMAASGVLVVTSYSGGPIITRHGLTTDTSDLNHREEMIRNNVDSFAYQVAARMGPYVGQSNVTPTALAKMFTELTSIINFAKSNGFTENLGPQLIDGTVVSVKQGAFADTVEAVLNCTFPAAANQILVHIVI